MHLNLNIPLAPFSKPLFVLFCGIYSATTFLAIGIIFTDIIADVTDLDFLTTSVTITPTQLHLIH
jgi:hypothetical protein